MPRIQFFILFIFFPIYVFSQNRPIIITEKVTGKRTAIYVENTTDTLINIFLMVHAEGYRKSASKPILKNIAGKRKVLMTTLIAIDNVASSYTYNLIINEKENDINFYNTNREVEDIESVLQNRLVLFTSDDCSKCTLLETLLTNQRLQHTSFNINSDTRLYKQFLAFVEKKGYTRDSIPIPVIWNKDELLYGDTSVEEILEKIKE